MSIQKAQVFGEKSLAGWMQSFGEKSLAGFEIYFSRFSRILTFLYYDKGSWGSDRLKYNKSNPNRNESITTHAESFKNWNSNDENVGGMESYSRFVRLQVKSSMILPYKEENPHLKPKAANEDGDDFSSLMHSTTSGLPEVRKPQLATIF